jgi:hypothetical protein
MMTVVARMALLKRWRQKSIWEKCWICPTFALGRNFVCHLACVVSSLSPHSYYVPFYAR